MASDNPERTRPFTYGIRRQADRAKVEQQNAALVRYQQDRGTAPSPHGFQGLSNNPSLCGQCLTTRDKPWHLLEDWLPTN